MSSTDIDTYLAVEVRSNVDGILLSVEDLFQFVHPLLAKVGLISRANLQLYSETMIKQYVHSTLVHPESEHLKVEFMV